MPATTPAATTGPEEAAAPPPHRPPGHLPPAARAAVMLAWLALVALLLARHEPWRDEVRALSFALRGDE